MDRQPVLEGERLLLRPLLESDRAAFLAAAGDPLIWEQHPDRGRWRDAECNRWFDGAVAEAGALAVIEKESGELVGSSSLILRSVFGGESGITTDRTSLPHMFGWSFGPQIQVYYLISFWLMVSAILMYALTRTPVGRMCNAVRDNPERVEFIGYDPHVVRYLACCFAGFFAGISLSIITGQLKRVTGAPIASDGLIAPFVDLLHKLPAVHWPSLALAVLMFAVLEGARLLRLRVPGPLIVVVLAVALSWLLDLPGHGIAPVGDIPSGLPRLALPSMGGVSPDRLLLGAVATFFVESAGVKLAVHERGHRDAPTVLLVHGYPDTSATWESVAEELAHRAEIEGHG